MENIKDNYSTLLGVKVKDYKCPKCGKVPADEYTIDEVEFPICSNESMGSDMDGQFHDWDELHKCTECGTDFWFRNGAY